MSTMSLSTPVRGPALKTLLGFDAGTCAGFGALLVAASGSLSGLLGLPAALLFYAGLALLPCAALMFVAMRTLNKALVWVVIVGNFAWVAASLAVAIALAPSALGMGFLLAQAAFVAVLGWLEMRAAR